MTLYIRRVSPFNSIKHPLARAPRGGSVLGKRLGEMLCISSVYFDNFSPFSAEK